MDRSRPSVSGLHQHRFLLILPALLLLAGVAALLRLVGNDFLSVAAALLFATASLVGLLVGSRWSTHRLDSRYRRIAQLHRLNEERAALRIGHAGVDQCPLCYRDFADTHLYDPAGRDLPDEIEAQVLRAIPPGVAYDLQQVCSASGFSLTQVRAVLDKLQKHCYIGAVTDSTGRTRYKRQLPYGGVGV